MCLIAGIQTTTCYWPVKVIDLNKVVLFKLQFYDAGEAAIKKFDHVLSVSYLYFFCYKTEFFFSFQSNPKNLDPSVKMDLDLWDCLGWVKSIIAKFHWTYLVNCSHSREGKTPSYSQINMVYLRQIKIQIVSVFLHFDSHFNLKTSTCFSTV